jgi:hypothetical protein
MQRFAKIESDENLEALQKTKTLKDLVKASRSKNSNVIG